MKNGLPEFCKATCTSYIFKEPEIPYSQLIPNNIIPDANDPKITYLRDASLDFWSFLLRPANMYDGILTSSNAK